MNVRARILWAMMRVWAWLPLRATQAVAHFLAPICARLPLRETKVARRNIAACFANMPANEREQLLRDCLAQTLMSLFELPSLWRADKAQMVNWIRSVENEDVFKQALASGQAVLIAAPHLGSWEVLNAYLSFHSKMALLYRPPKTQWLEDVLNKARCRFGATAIRADAAGVRQLLKHLEAGGTLGILPDQQPKVGEGGFAPFFGVPAMTMTLFAKMAQKKNVQVLIAYAERLPHGKGFDLHFAKADPTIIDATTLNANIETAARQLPAQYQWTYKRFSMRPSPDEPGFYAKR
jgi:Kdo2-lipid IVA lauroyltransferase/acyltransferase